MPAPPSPQTSLPPITLLAGVALAVIAALVMWRMSTPPAPEAADTGLCGKLQYPKQHPLPVPPVRTAGNPDSMIVWGNLQNCQLIYIPRPAYNTTKARRTCTYGRKPGLGWRILPTNTKEIAGSADIGPNGQLVFDDAASVAYSDRPGDVWQIFADGVELAAFGIAPERGGPAACPPYP